MENLIRGQRYYIRQYETTIDKVEHYSEYRAKFLGKHKGINEFMSFANINYYKINYRPTYTSEVPAVIITKMENLIDITNEMLPNHILLKIDEYI
jgi:hypothetical protein